MRFEFSDESRRQSNSPNTFFGLWSADLSGSVDVADRAVNKETFSQQIHVLDLETAHLAYAEAGKSTNDDHRAVTLIDHPSQPVMGGLRGYCDTDY